MKTYWNTTGSLKKLNEWQPNCWIQVTCPTDEDQQELEKRFDIPDYFFPDISDTDERARYEYDDGWMLIILLPQVVKRVVPASANEVITLVKDTALAQVLGVLEMFTLAKKTASSSVSVMPLVAAGIIYFFLNGIVSWAFVRIEKKLDYYR